MPWHTECRAKMQYPDHSIQMQQGTEKIKIHEDAQRQTEIENPVKISHIISRRFRRALRKKTVVELFHVTVQNMKPRKSHKYGDAVERILKIMDEIRSEEFFKQLKHRHTQRPELTKILDKNRAVFKNKADKRNTTSSGGRPSDRDHAKCHTTNPKTLPTIPSGFDLCQGIHSRKLRDQKIRLSK